MESKIIKQEKNPFLHREEFIIEIESEVNPSFKDVEKIVGKNNELTVVKKIQNNFGRRIFTAEVFVYDSKEDRERVETIPKKIKKKMIEDAKQKEDAKIAQESPQETPKEGPSKKSESQVEKPKEKKMQEPTEAKPKGEVKSEGSKLEKPPAQEVSKDRGE